MIDFIFEWIYKHKCSTLKTKLEDWPVDWLASVEHQIATFQTPGRYFLKPGVEVESFKRRTSESGRYTSISAINICIYEGMIPYFLYFVTRLLFIAYDLDFVKSLEISHVTFWYCSNFKSEKTILDMLIIFLVQFLIFVYYSHRFNMFPVRPSGCFMAFLSVNVSLSYCLSKTMMTAISDKPTLNFWLGSINLSWHWFLSFTKVTSSINMKFFLLG